MPETTERSAYDAPPEKQDLHESRPHAPDKNWARMQPIQITPSAERLNADHQLVNVKNVSDVQVLPGGRPAVPQIHIVIDRHMVGHELRPGEKKNDIDMLTADIEYFLRERAANRYDQFGRAKPLHPIVIEGFKPIDAPRVDERKLEGRPSEARPEAKPHAQAAAR
jgi:hypothetical protein